MRVVLPLSLGERTMAKRGGRGGGMGGGGCGEHNEHKRIL